MERHKTRAPASIHRSGAVWWFGGPEVPADFQALEGAYSSKNNSITVLQRRGAVFLACHNAIWEASEHLLAASINPDELSHEAMAAELTNHLIPGVVLTPGVVGTLPELQMSGFAYAK